MRLPKRRLPYVILAVLVVTQTAVIALRIDFWPFTCYPMFSDLHTLDQVGAYQMEAFTRDKQTLTVPLRGGKNIWRAYHSLVNSQDFAGLQSQMKRDMEYFITETHTVKMEEISEVRLHYVGLAPSTNQEKVVSKKLLYSMNL